LAETRAFRRLVRKLTEENLWLYIIAVLLRKPMYAYEVKTNIEKVFGFKPKTITVYAVLYRMVREGLLVTERKDGVKLYLPTDKGIKAFKEGLKFIGEMLYKLGGTE